MGIIENTIIAGTAWTKAHTTELLTAGIITGVVGTGIFSFKAGLKAARILDAKKQDLMDIHPDDREAKRAIIGEAIKEMAPSILLASAIGLGTIACTWKAYSFTSAQIATLTGIAGLSAKQIADLNAEMLESLGEKKTKQIRDKAIQRRFNQENPNDGEECRYLIDCGGDVLCCDIYGDVYFMSTHENVRQAIEALGYQCADMGKVDLNDLYLKLKIPPKDWAAGVIWTYRDLIYEPNNFGVPIPKLPITTTTIIGFNDKPCLGIRYDIC